MEAQLLLRLYRTMLTSRQIDRIGEELNRQGIAPFHLNCAGHESVAVVAAHLNSADWIHCHYRSRAMLLHRGISSSQFFHEILGTESGKSRGRRMGVFFSDPKLNVVSMVTPVANNALQCVGIASTVREQDEQPIVVCGVGDGSTQQGEFLEALNEASRRRTPVLFFIEDNRWAISTQTQGKTFYSLTGEKAAEFCGIPIRYIDGRDVTTAYEEVGEVITKMRSDREPAIIVFEVERLSDHTSTDDQRRYRDEEEIERAKQTSDPLEICRQRLLEAGFSDADLSALQASIDEEIEAAQQAALNAEDPPAARSAKKPLPIEMTHPSHEAPGDGPGEFVMREAIREVLNHHLKYDPRVRLLGQDIEDPKGDVFGVTRGLSTEYPGRVENATLSESTILGVSIGQTLAGDRPVAFIQFADFLPQAFNQIVAELSTMYWRSDGDWHTPVIVMAACGGYRPGLGPYHAQTMESLFAHTPGLDVFMPSSAADAAGMLNAAFKSERPTLFFYPKSLLNDSKRSTSGQIADHFIPIGTSKKLRAGRDISFVTWGSTVPLCEEVAKLLEDTGIESEIIDLRSLSPWDERSVIASAEKNGPSHRCARRQSHLRLWGRSAGYRVRESSRSDCHSTCCSRRHSYSLQL